MRALSTSRSQNTSRTTSKRIRHTRTTRDEFGRRLLHPVRELLGSQAVRARQVDAVQKQNERIAGEIYLLRITYIVR
jgi:hypothetical protein